MKKILTIFLMMFFINNVQALEYTEYTNFSDYTDQYIQKDDLTDVKIERRYKYYKLEKELGNYGKENPNYPLIDKEDYIYTEYSKPTLEKPEEKEDRIIETINGYHYKKIKDINYIKLEATMADLIIENLKVIYKEKELEYEIETKKVEGNKIKQDGYIKICLKEPIDISQTILVFDTKEKSDKEGILYIKIGKDQEQYAYTLFQFPENKTLNLDCVDFPANQKVFEDYYSETELKTGRAIKKIKEVTLYKYKDKQYRNYKLNKIYLDKYLIKPYEDYIYKDNTQYKDYYAKRTRTIKEENNPKQIQPKQNPKPIEKKQNQNNYKVPAKALYYPLNINKLEDINKITPNNLSIQYFPIIILIGIIILVLSKLYKNKKDCAKVWKGDDMLEIDIRPIKGILFVRLKGKLNKNNINKLNHEVIKLQENVGIKNIVFNIQELNYIDKYGKYALINSFNLCMKNKGQSFICLGDNKQISNKLEKVFSKTNFVSDELSALNLINS